MPSRTKPKVGHSIAARAKEVLAFAEQRAQTASDWIELHRAIYGVKGKASTLFTTEEDRAAFVKTKESRRIGELMDRLPMPPVRGFYPPQNVPRTNGRKSSAVSCR